MTDLSSPLSFAHGPALKNRFMLAPLTNLQSHPDGTLGEDEFRWLSMRAEGGFGMTMTCAASVQAAGLGFPGQLGVYDDRHLPGMTRLAEAINKAGSLSVVQLHHAGMRSLKQYTGQDPLCPSDNEETGARAMTEGEIAATFDDFVHAAKRCQKAGFHGVELHGAHGYLIGQFISAEINKRTDAYGGPYENRVKLLMDLIDAVRSECGKDFSLGVRLSPERFGMDLAEIRRLAEEIMTGGKFDYLDMSLWDTFKEPEDAAFKGKPLVEWFTSLKRGNCRLGAAGKLTTGAACRKAMEAGLDFVVIGRGAILHHDFPKRVEADPDFTPIALPVPEAHLRKEGLGDAFVGYMKTWKGFVEDTA